MSLGTTNQPHPPNRSNGPSQPQGPGRPPGPPGPSGPPPGAPGFGGGFGSPPFHQQSFSNTSAFSSPSLIGGGGGGVVCGCGDEAILLTVRNEQSTNKGTLLAIHDASSDKGY